MKTIWKWQITEPADVFSWVMPVGAKVLALQAQAGVLCVWAEVDTEAPREPRRFRLAGTGHELGEVGRYVGTSQLSYGGLVLHLYEMP